MRLDVAVVSFAVALLVAGFFLIFLAPAAFSTPVEMQSFQGLPVFFLVWGFVMVFAVLVLELLSFLAFGFYEGGGL